MSFPYGSKDDFNEAEAIATLERSLELGINFWDTADMYADGANETLLCKVLATKGDKVFLATKFGSIITQTALRILMAGRNT